MLDARRRPMFLRQYTRKKAGKVHRYGALVESVRTEEGPRQRVVAHLGELNHSQQRRWQRTVVFYNRHGDIEQLRLFPDDTSLSLPDDPDIVRVRLSTTGWTHARAFGNVWLGLWLWRLLKLDEILDRHLPAGRHTVRPADVVAIEVINRLCGPASEFALAEPRYASTGLEDLLKSELLIRPMWHQYDGRVEAHVMICVLAYALWKTLDHLAKQAGLMTEIRKPDTTRGRATAKARPMSPEVILRELSKIQIGDIMLDTSDGRQLALRRVARPMPEQAKILAALKLNLPERLSPDRLL